MRIEKHRNWSIATRQIVRRSGRGTGKGRHTFVSSGDVEWFKRLGGRLLGPEVDDVEAHQWD